MFGIIHESGGVDFTEAHRQWGKKNVCCLHEFILICCNEINLKFNS